MKLWIQWMLKVYSSWTILKLLVQHAYDGHNIFIMIMIIILVGIWLRIYAISCPSIRDDSTQTLQFTAPFKSSILMTYFCWQKKNALCTRTGSTAKHSTVRVD